MKSSQSPDSRAYLAYAAVCLAWGSTYLAIRIGVSDLPPALFAGVRFLMAGSLMLAYARLTKLNFPKTYGELRIVSTVGLLLLFGGNGLVVWSEQYIPSGLAALTISTSPLFVAVLDHLVPGGTRMGPGGWAGMLLGFAGVGLLVLPGLGLQQADLRGIFGLLGAAALWGIGSVYSSRNAVSGSMLALSALENLAAGIALTITGAAAGELQHFSLTLRGAGAVLYLVFAGSIIGYSCFLYILKAMPPARASTYSYVNPVVAVVLGWLVLNESLGLREILCTAVVLAGVMLVQTSRFRPNTPENKPGEGDFSSPG